MSEKKKSKKMSNKTLRKKLKKALRANEKLSEDAIKHLMRAVDVESEFNYVIDRIVPEIGNYIPKLKDYSNPGGISCFDMSESHDKANAIINKYERVYESRTNWIIIAVISMVIAIAELICLCIFC